MLRGKRVDGWDIRFREVIENYKADNKPVRYGKKDCFLFAADVTESIYGFDIMEPYRPLYSNRVEAYKLIRDLGGKGLADSFERILMAGPIRVTMAQRGDIVVHQQDNLEAVGVCAGKNSLFLKGRGFFSMPTSYCLKAFTFEEGR